jgi:hypothetical protein
MGSTAKPRVIEVQVSAPETQAWTLVRTETIRTRDQIHVVSLYQVWPGGAAASRLVKIALRSDPYPIEQASAQAFVWDGSAWSLVWNMLEAEIRQAHMNPYAHGIRQALARDEASLLDVTYKILSGGA